ncbi:MAG: hypothetical protein PHI32_08300, partial [Dysgonamonadaceae bacterium]|nr:hypothetical protein [Dysgonamonadaceae bacterium]
IEFINNHAKKKEVCSLGQYIFGVADAIVVGVCDLHHHTIAVLSIKSVSFCRHEHWLFAESYVARPPL